MCAAAPMLFTSAPDERCTGSLDTSARHTLFAGNTPHGPAVAEGDAVGLGLAVAVAETEGAVVPAGVTKPGSAGPTAFGVVLPQAASPRTAVSAASRRGTAARDRERTRRI
ncbi:hypothetical protein GCM10009661_10150 [Catellatospora chokoriensis]|uniref:Uncharacterized protein n=1 Tax=Catellatospora chokoriensis TaxID=310353 RepID=A0A8J3K0E6_9ACTN|nr:hypothetical protein Cch02nite_51980 [Catellatospora chokoriensis]